MSKFRENLKALRESQGLTQEMLGEKIGIAKSTVSMYESGNREPSFEILEAIADQFNVSLARLMGDECGTELSPEEEQLLSDYRLLSVEGKKYVRQSVYMAKMACSLGAQQGA